MAKLLLRLTGTLSFRTDAAGHTGDLETVVDPRVFTIGIDEARRVPDPSRLTPFKIEDEDGKLLATVTYDNTPRPGRFDRASGEFEMPVGLTFSVKFKLESYIELVFTTATAQAGTLLPMQGSPAVSAADGARIALAAAGTFSNGVLTNKHLALRIEGLMVPDPMV